MHFAMKTMCSRINKVCTFINRKTFIWKKKTKNLVIEMPKSVVPQKPARRCCEN